jgi:glucose/mannose-6-phosphate isomerase
LADSLLDSPSTVSQLDPHGLLQRIETLPEQFEDGWRLATSLSLPTEAQRASQVVVLGMGGSAIAGDFLASLAQQAGRKPVAVVRGYHAPAFATSNTLVIACSHSGNTEETLSAFEQTLEAGCTHVVVTTGGKIAETARERGLPVYHYQYAGEPRSALGYQLAGLLRIAESAGVIAGAAGAIEQTVALMQAQREELAFDCAEKQNKAKQIARRLHNRLPVMVGAETLAVAAHRWKTQVNENADAWAFWEELPEMDHNTVVGFARPEKAVPHLHAVLLHSRSLHPRVRLRYDITESELAAAGVSHERVEIVGDEPLAQALSAAYLGDLVSYYLALLEGVQPSPVKPIDRVKAKLRS